MRLGFVLLCFLLLPFIVYGVLRLTVSLPFIVYGVLWLTVSTAQTRTERQLMSKKVVSAKSINEKINNLGKNNSLIRNKIKGFFGECFNILRNVVQSLFNYGKIIFTFLFKIIKKTFGLSLIILSILCLLFVSVIFTGTRGPWGSDGGFIFNYGSLPELLGYVFDTQVMIVITSVMIGIFLLIPILLIFNLGLKNIIKIQVRSKQFKLPIIILWVLLAGGLLHISLMICRKYSEEETAYQKTVIENKKVDLQLGESDSLIKSDDVIHHKFRKVSIKAIYTDDENIVVKLKKRAYANTLVKAHENISNLNYRLTGDTIYIDQYANDTSFCFQDNSCYIYLPDSCELVVLDKNNQLESSYIINEFLYQNSIKMSGVIHRHSKKD